MVIQKENKFLLLLILEIVLCTCNNNEHERIDNILSFSTKGMITYDSRIEQWGNFIADGYKIEIYTIKNNTLIDSARLYCFTYDSLWIYNHFQNSQMNKMLNNTSGFYKKIELEDQVEYVFIDTNHKKLIYYLEIW